MSASFQHTRPLSDAVYTALTDVSRCLHIDDVVETHADQMLTPYSIRNSSTGFMNKSVLWVAPTKPPEEHNFYGNVSFIIDWRTVFEKFGPNLYLIDQSILARTSYTRVLLTSTARETRAESTASRASKTTSNLSAVRTIFDEDSDIEDEDSDTDFDFLSLILSAAFGPGYGASEKVDLNATGSPLIEKDGQIYHASSVRCKKGGMGLHEVQIGIETDDEGGRWFYEHCVVQPNEHSQANRRMIIPVQRGGKSKSYESFKCFKFNTAGDCVCPYPLSASATETLIKAKCPGIMSKFSTKIASGPVTLGGTSSNLVDGFVKPFDENLRKELAAISRDDKFKLKSPGVSGSRTVSTIFDLKTPSSADSTVLVDRISKMLKVGNNGLSSNLSSSRSCDVFMTGTGSSLRTSTEPTLQTGQSSEPSLEELRKKRLQFLNKFA